MTITRTVFCLFVTLALIGCAKRPPADTSYQKPSYHSAVTVTGNDVPGPLVIREFNVWLEDGETRREVPLGGQVNATFSAWINGHGKFVARWEVDGEVVDRVAFFITYGETLRITLQGKKFLPTEKLGEHTVRFIMEAPEKRFVDPELVYVVTDPNA